MKRYVLKNKFIGSLKWGFVFGALVIFTIFPLHFDLVDGIRSDLLLANQLIIEKDTLIKDPATGQMIPFSELKSKNPKLSSSLNQLLSAYQFGGEPRMNAFAKETSMELNNDLIQVVIVVSADSHEPLAKEMLENLKSKILEVGGRFELHFHNLLQVLLPVHALEEVANWPEVKFIREPFRPHPMKNSSETGDQSKAGFFKLISSNQSDKSHENEISMEYLKKNSENSSFEQGELIELQLLKDSCDHTICPKKKIEKFFPDPSTYECISDDEVTCYENYLEENQNLKREEVSSPKVYSTVKFCTECNCSSITVTFGNVTHPHIMKCNTRLLFNNVPPGIYSWSGSGCGASWNNNIEILEGDNWLIWFCPKNNLGCCPIGCGDGGSFRCADCQASPKPNLTPFKPSGWSDKNVVSTNTGDHLDDSPLYDTDMLYIDFAWANLGSAPTEQTYYFRLFIDDVIIFPFHVDPPNEPNFGGMVSDLPIDKLSAGTHTIKLDVDYDNRIAESNETDNEYTKTITVLCDPAYQSATSEGLTLIGGDKWQDDDYTGQGVKIAIIDNYFKNYSSVLGRDLPDSVTTQFFGSHESVHGTACAEIIHDFAPDAQFFLAQSRTSVEFLNAVNWCISQGVHVISCSMGFPICLGPLDGTGLINDIVNQAVNVGIVWVNAAGNEAQAHWSGDFYDPDGDGFLNFSATDNVNHLKTYPNEDVTIGMIWDDPWGASDNDYDLYVVRLDTSAPIAYSVDQQNGNDDPCEHIKFTPQTGVSYGFAVKKKSGISKHIHVTFNSQNQLDYQVPATSICIPADNPNVITVGAVAWNTPDDIEDFSSRGPTTDGRIKPDLVAPDRVSTSNYTYGTNGFAGTSAACPHVAGACALVKQAFPSWSHTQIKNYLEQNASDLGTTGKDNIYGSGLINLPDSSSFENLLYFPHIASNSEWETEICVINTSSEQSLSGDLKAYNNSGQEVSSTPVILASNGRREIIIGDELPNPSGIGYIIFESDSENVCGYTKFYIEGKYRVAVPATSDINAGDIYMSHIASNTNWWTGVSLLNTTSSSKQITVEFDNGTTKPITIAAKEHQAFTINSLFGAVLQPNINSAVIKNGSGIVGLELFGSSDSSGDNYLSGILLKDDTTTHIYYPHIASDSTWWTGIVAYNPSITSSNLTITPFSKDGTSLTPQTRTLAGKEKYIGTANGLNFPDGTAWFRIVATSPITGFELFGTNDGNQLGGYTGVGISGTNGVFAKTEKDGWTGIAFVNIENAPATVAMTAYNDSGNVITTKSLNINAYEKVVDVAPNLFSQDISNATYISYSSGGEVVGFQLNGSSDDMMLDGLPGM